MKILYIIIGLLLSNQLTAQKLKHAIRVTTSDTQCFTGNNFCIIDSIIPEEGVKIKSAMYLFDDGTKLQFDLPPNNTIMVCNHFGDPSNGLYGMTIRIEDLNGNIISSRHDRLFFVMMCQTKTETINKESPLELKYDFENQMAMVQMEDYSNSVVYDVSGRTIDNIIDYTKGIVQINLSSLNSGIYILAITNTNGFTRSIRLIVP